MSKWRPLPGIADVTVMLTLEPGYGLSVNWFVEQYQRQLKCAALRFSLRLQEQPPDRSLFDLEGYCMHERYDWSWCAFAQKPALPAQPVLEEAAPFAGQAPGEHPVPWSIPMNDLG